jgi:hypothetical protein
MTCPVRSRVNRTRTTPSIPRRRASSGYDLCCASQTASACRQPGLTGDGAAALADPVGLVATCVAGASCAEEADVAGCGTAGLGTGTCCGRGRRGDGGAEGRARADAGSGISGGKGGEAGVGCATAGGGDVSTGGWTGGGVGAADASAGTSDDGANADLSAGTSDDGVDADLSAGTCDDGVGTDLSAGTGPDDEGSANTISTGGGVIGGVGITTLAATSSTAMSSAWTDTAASSAERHRRPGVRRRGHGALAAPTGGALSGGCPGA